MSRRYFIQSCLSAGAALQLSACAAVGPTAIGNGRAPYNDVIHSTASQQTLLNIVRVHNDETPQFVDVSEVDEATTVAGSVGGGASNIGAGAIGAITGAGSYQEAPTVRYIPLLGQALIAQVSTPISVDSLTNLYNSDWDLGAVLTLGVDRITPGYLEYEAAINALIELDKYGAIIIAATQSTESEQSGKSKGLSISPPGTKDTLAIYLKDKNTAITRARCDGLDASPANAKKVVNALWARLKAIYGVSKQIDSKPLTIKSKGSPFVTAKNDGAPLLATRSALGVLKNAAEDENPALAFLPEFEVRELMRRAADENRCANDFYVIDPINHRQSQYQKHETQILKEKISDYINSTSLRSHVTAFPLKVKLTSDELLFEEALANTRKFMLVAESDTPPSDAYTSVRHGNMWYSILDGDRISKRTLALINQFNTIQAIPSQTPPLTPTITVSR